MNKKPTPEEMAYANALSIEALINVLVEKGIVTKEEVLASIKKLGEERINNLKKMKK
ncbi:hypothetical protein J7J58_03700 [candidate division WOR-3 bacterium]|nr:hypothetical protein [candidate division WOR-3 bacterium]